VVVPRAEVGRLRPRGPAVAGAIDEQRALPLEHGEGGAPSGSTATHGSAQLFRPRSLRAHVAPPSDDRNVAQSVRLKSGVDTTIAAATSRCGSLGWAARWGSMSGASFGDEGSARSASSTATDPPAPADILVIANMLAAAPSASAARLTFRPAPSSRAASSPRRSP
jgi:hypothetical protein